MRQDAISFSEYPDAIKPDTARSWEVSVETIRLHSVAHRRLQPLTVLGSVEFTKHFPEGGHFKRSTFS